MVFLNQILFKYYENLGICYILYYLDIHQKKKLKSTQPVVLNPGAQLLFVTRSIGETMMTVVCQVAFPLPSHIVKAGEDTNTDMGYLPG